MDWFFSPNDRCPEMYVGETITSFIGPEDGKGKSDWK